MCICVVCNSQFRKHYLNQLTEKSHIRRTRITIKWIGLDSTACSVRAGKIDILGMKGDENFFNISIPEEQLPTQWNREGMSVLSCFHKSVIYEEVSAHGDLQDYWTGIQLYGDCE